MRQVHILIETLFSLLYTTLLKVHPGMAWVHFYSVNLDIYSGTKIAMDIKSGKFPQAWATSQHRN